MTTSVGSGSAGQHPVIDLQAVKRAGQHQQVDEEREDADREKGRAALVQTPRDSSSAPFLLGAAAKSAS